MIFFYTSLSLGRYLRISLSPRRERVRVRGRKIYDIFSILPTPPP